MGYCGICSAPLRGDDEINTDSINLFNEAQRGVFCGRKFSCSLPGKGSFCIALFLSACSLGFGSTATWKELAMQIHIPSGVMSAMCAVLAVAVLAVSCLSSSKVDQAVNEMTPIHPL